MQWMVGEIPVEVTRKSVKNLNLRVRRDGQVVCSAPRRMSDRAIRTFLTEKQSWIRSARQKLAGQDMQLQRQYQSGETILLWGELLPLRVFPARKARLSKTTDAVILEAPEESTVTGREALFEDWYRRLLRDRIEERLPLWEEKTSLHPAEVKIRKMKGRWGSCHTVKKTVTLSLWLVQQPEECLDYVILHELAHLRYPDHGAGFHAYLDSQMPGWKEIRKRLNALKDPYAPVPKE